LFARVEGDKPSRALAWFQKQEKGPAASAKGPTRTEGLWAKCDSCSEIVYRQELEQNLMVCPHCGHHFPLPARARLVATLDADSFEELDSDLTPLDPLGFTDSKRYRDRLRTLARSLKETDAFVSGIGQVHGHAVSVGAFAFDFMGGSMGSVVGEKVTRLFERAHERGTPAVIFCASGGARMQEGILSLMQMAKTSAAIARFRGGRKPYVSVLCHPTTGGVAASFAWLGDVILAEPKALIGFAGPRVIEQSIRQKLPEGFQRSEFLVEHGMLDAIVTRKELRDRLGQILGLLVTRS
jgi:acetyl-CoA carboxylase carboxyl transferase subunit beta